MSDHPYWDDEDPRHDPPTPEETRQRELEEEDRLAEKGPAIQIARGVKGMVVLPRVPPGSIDLSEASPGLPAPIHPRDRLRDAPERRKDDA